MKKSDSSKNMPRKAGNYFKKLLAYSQKGTRYVRKYIEYKFRPSESDEKLTSDAQDYWKNTNTELVKQYSHWRGAGVFTDEDRWLALGKQNLEFFRQFCRMKGEVQSPRRVLEWGCGGGANAIQFAPLAESYVGIEVAQSSLAECATQLEAIGFRNFEPVLFDAKTPQAVIPQIKKKCDLFLSTYVFELLPTQNYGLQVLEIAYELLNSNGLAMIQIRYVSNSWSSKPKRFSYKKHVGGNNAYRVEEFWEMAIKCGFKPEFIKLVPRETIIDDTNYAYFFLSK